MAITQKADNQKLSFMDDMKAIIRKNMKEKGLTSAEARKSLGIKKYEKKQHKSSYGYKYFYCRLV